jgi:hypothetical protein
MYNKNDKLKEELIAFLTEVVTLYQTTNQDNNEDSFDLLTCIVTSLASHPIIADHPHIKQFTPMLPLFVPKMEPMIKPVIMKNIEINKIAPFINEKLSKCGGGGCDLMEALGPLSALLPMFMGGFDPCNNNNNNNFGMFLPQMFNMNAPNFNSHPQPHYGFGHGGWHGHHGHRRGGCGGKCGGGDRGRHCGSGACQGGFKKNKNNKSNLRADIIKNPMPMESQSVVDPEQGIVKTWTMTNTGKDDLPSGLIVKYCGRRNNPMVSCNKFCVGNINPIKPGQEFIVRVSISTPKNYGCYESNWRLITPDGARFGQKLPFILVLNAPNDQNKDVETKQDVDENNDENNDAKDDDNEADENKDEEPVIESTINEYNKDNDSVSDDFTKISKNEIESLAAQTINQVEQEKHEQVDMVVDTGHSDDDVDDQDIYDDVHDNNDNDDNDDNNDNDADKVDEPNIPDIPDVPDVPEYEFQQQYVQLQSMGFGNEEELLKSLLDVNQGDIDAVVAVLIQ